MLKVSGTETSPGALVPAVASPDEPTALALSAFPCSLPLACETALPAPCACLAGKPCAGAAPGAPGLFPPPGGVAVLDEPEELGGVEDEPLAPELGGAVMPGEEAPGA